MASSHGTLGRSAQRVALSGTVNVQPALTTGTPASTVETSLGSFTLPQGALAVDGAAIRITAWFSLAANGNSKTPSIRIGGTVAAPTSGTSIAALATTVSGAGLIAEAIVIRRSATAFDAIGRAGSTNNTISNVTTNQTLTNSSSFEGSAGVRLDFTGLNGVASANDIVLRGILIESLGENPAAS